MKQRILTALCESGFEVVDYGDLSLNPGDDYPDFVVPLARAVSRGEVERGDASRITGLPERTARRVLNEVINEGLLASETPKGPVSLRVPTATLELLFPKLYPVA